MDLPNYSKAYEEHEKKWTCECSGQIYVYRIFTNGMKHWGKQCLNCGKWRSVKQCDVPLRERSILPLFDPDISLKFQDRKQKDYGSSVQSVKQEEYQSEQEKREAYYKTPAWKMKCMTRRNVNTKLFGGRCEICFENRGHICHHMTYERLYNEWIFDLACVCEECHTGLHAPNPFWSGHSSGD
jgi:hypothetical protein